MLLDSPPPHPVFHLGMTGSTQVGGQAALIYRAPRASNNPQVWPPKYTKIVMTFSDENSGEAIAEWAFSDSRRLARIRLIDAVDPETLPPLSLLGRDPHLDMISVEELSEKLKKRKAPIKAIMLDQNGPVCGIGNWMIDEILYQARLHPSHTGSVHFEPSSSFFSETFSQCFVDGGRNWSTASLDKASHGNWSTSQRRPSTISRRLAVLATLVKGEEGQESDHCRWNGPRNHLLHCRRKDVSRR